MTQQLATLNATMLPASIQQMMGTMTQSELSQGVGANYAVVSIRGKVFRIKYGGAETPVMINFNGTQMTAPYLDVVILKANGVLSKTYYKDAFSDGSDGQPDCWSEDGINPLAPMAQRPIVPLTGAHCVDCRICPLNAFGSKIAPSGKPIKACADTRKLAMVPESNIANDAFGGPMLMRVPGASLAPLAEFDRHMVANGIPYFAVVVRISFDQDPAYPKLVFTPVRGISEQEAQQVLRMRDGPAVALVLGGAHAVPQALPPPVTTAPVPATSPTQAETNAQALAAFEAQQEAQKRAFLAQSTQAPSSPASQVASAANVAFAPPPAVQVPSAANVAFTPPPAAATFAPPPAAAFAPPPAAAFAPPPAAAFDPAAFAQLAGAPAAAPVAPPPQGGATPVASVGLLSEVDALLGL